MPTSELTKPSVELPRKVPSSSGRDSASRRRRSTCASSRKASGTHERALPFAGQRLRPLICYEDLFGEDVVASALDSGEPAATVFVNVSNLAWFGPRMVQDQHLQFSQMRALEFQRPIVRATNTGATAHVDHRGRVLARLPAEQAGVLEVSVDGRSGATPYARWLAMLGLWPLWALAALGVLPVLARRRADPARFA